MQKQVDNFTRTTHFDISFKMGKSTERIAEFYAQENSGYSKIIIKDKPSVYLLNATDNSLTSDIRWFEIGQPSQNNNQDHKVMILMGATGSGKSTLIDGMVNFILGVQWKDPFRFRCVREDESQSGNQAHSQTSSVTAYTIHHQEGMAVPYSVTLIDTPGYGDTRGVARDKEITKIIHQFLLEKDTRIDEIHAACFVAASSNSRLTVTQRYILDSVLSIFGKDFKDNIRLLVTFADNADPPVIEACRVAHFPMSSPSDGIIYSKFNSSVLYASNEENGESSFDELFWDMGQENFANFFKMLEGMNGKDLKSTRQVIQQCQILQQSLKDIEQQLEVYFEKIEKEDLILEKMKTAHGYKLKGTAQYFNPEKKIRVKCDEGRVGYNCKLCQQTCEERILLKNPEKIYRQKPCQSCYCLSRNHSTERFVWQKVSGNIKTPVQDSAMKDITISKHKEELSQTKAKVIDLLNQVGDSGRLLDSAALRSNALTPADYLRLMRSRVAEEQKPGYLIRLETLTDLQQMMVETSLPIPEDDTIPVDQKEKNHISFDTEIIIHKLFHLFSRLVFYVLRLTWCFYKVIFFKLPVFVGLVYFYELIWRLTKRLIDKSRLFVHLTRMFKELLESIQKSHENKR